MSQRTLVVSLVLLGGFVQVSSADMLIAGGSAYYNQSDRFYAGADKNFQFSQFDFSGVGNTNGPVGNGQWATLISPNFILEANHYHAPQNSTITFNLTNSSNSSVNFTIGPGMEVGNTDLYVAELTQSTAGSGLVPYAVAADNQSALTNAQIYGVGIPWRVGTNNIDTFTAVGGNSGNPSPSNGESNQVFLYDYNTKVSPFENEVQIYDSGGPSFVANQDQLLLVGIHWFYGTADYTPNPISGDTYVSPYVLDIDATMRLIDPTTTDSVTVLPYLAPEPSSIALTALGACGLIAWSRRPRRTRSAGPATSGRP